MKILVTGIKGKIGAGFLEYISESRSNIQADTLSLRDEKWRERDFGIYDAVYYCIGITDPSSPDIYKINAELAYEFAKKVKADGVKKFIYLSSMAVYDFSGDSNMQPIGKDVPATAKGKYGESKRMGEEKLVSLADPAFAVQIIRAPSIYGRNTEGYLEFISAATKYGYFSNFKNWKRSIIYIDNLSELVCLICESEASEMVEYYYPQNKEQYSFAELAENVADVLHTKRRKISLSAKWEKRLQKTKMIKRKYRPYAYSEELSNAFDYRYCVVSAADSIQLTLKEKKTAE